MIYATKIDKSFVLVSHFDLHFSRSAPTDIVAHPRSTNTVILGNSYGELIWVELSLPSELLGDVPHR